MGFAKGSIHGEKLWRATYRLRLMRSLPPIVAQMVADLRGEGLDDEAIRGEVLAALERALLDVMPVMDREDAGRAAVVPDVALRLVEDLLREGGVDVCCEVSGMGEGAANGGRNARAAR